MKLSIITINYNNLEGLRKTINSVVSQTWRDFEWIVVDGGSTDGSRELIEEYAAKGCFAWWCSEKDKGVYNAMNKGIKHAQGEYLNFMNSGDCFHESTTLEQVFDEMKYDADILYGDVCYIYESGERMESAVEPLTLQHLSKGTIFHQSSFIRRELLNNGYDESLRIVSDWKMWIVWVLQNRSYTHLPIIVSDMDTTGISLNNVPLRQQERKQVLDEIVSPCIMRTIEKLQKQENLLLYNPEIMQVYECISKRRLYKRIIHSTLKLIGFLDKVIG